MDYFENLAEDFCKKNSVKVDITFRKADKYFLGDEMERNIYDVTLNRNGKSYTYTFGDSYLNTRYKISPSVYDVLACLEKEDVGTYEDFVQLYAPLEERGTEEDIEKLYEDVKAQYEAVYDLFSDVWDEFRKIA